MYTKLNITENNLQALSLFTNGFDNEYYIREAKKLLKISPRTAQLVLESLETKGIIESKIKGKIKLYRLQNNALCRQYLAFVEQYKSLAFLEYNLLIKEIIEKISPFINGIGVIFGSYAKGIADKNSDLDVFIAGRYDAKEIRKISETLGLDISVKCYPRAQFEKNIHKDIFLKEVLKNHIIFLNAEQFIRTVLDNG